MKMSTYLHSFAFAAAVLVSSAAYSSVLYVDSLADESADGDGASPETALATLDAAAATAAATAADGDEIRILGGKGRCRRACVCHWLLVASASGRLELGRGGGLCRKERT